jgi:Niemann-Pick C1 protein
VKCEREFEENGIRPTVDTFNKYVNFFLSDLPDENCAKAGRAAYSAGMNYISTDIDKHFVQDSYFMSYHTTAITSEEFYTALKKARVLSAEIEEAFKAKGKDLKVFPYSIFYVYYEQYLTIWEDALTSLGLSLAAVFVVTFIVTGSIIFGMQCFFLFTLGFFLGLDIMSALIVLFMVFLILLDMVGMMWLWNISLNAISIVNLVVSVGIGVEFVSHIVRSYKNFAGNHLERASKSLSLTGSSVLSGITLTKFAGIVVLAFAKSQVSLKMTRRIHRISTRSSTDFSNLLLPYVLGNRFDRRRTRAGSSAGGFEFHWAAFKAEQTRLPKRQRSSHRRAA